MKLLVQSLAMILSVAAAIAAEPPALAPQPLLLPPNVSPEVEELRRVLDLVAKNPSQVNARDSSGTTALVRSARDNYLAVAALLLDNGANVNLGQPLNAAILGGHREMAQLLIDRGADVNAAGNSGLTPLHQAAVANARGIVELLLARQVEVNPVDANGRTPLDATTDPRIVELLKDHGARNAPPRVEMMFPGFHRAETVLTPDGMGAGRWQRCSLPGIQGRIYHSAIWTGKEMIVWGGGSDGRFLNDGARYNPDLDEWRTLPTVGAPSGRWCHIAIWTGKEMIIWGGRSNFAPQSNQSDGARYDPIQNTWRPMSEAGAPSARSQMAAVWTGKELLIWGGWTDGGTCLRTGGRYNPETDSWRPMSMTGAPEESMEVGAVWSGKQMLVWGGLLAGQQRSASGGIYDPESDAWTAFPTNNAPLPARGVQPIWAGKEMLAWSGNHLALPNVNQTLKGGARYHTESKTWQPWPTAGEPSARNYYLAVWTSSEMIVWGGGVTRNMSTGGRFNPEKNRWVETANVGAPLPRGLATAVWTGKSMMVFGGSQGGPSAFNDAWQYFPPGVSESPRLILEEAIKLP